MDELMNRLEALTAKAVRQLEEWTDEDIIAFVEQRESLISALKELEASHANKAKYREQVSRILQFDQLIVQRMEQLSRVNSSGMKKMQSAKMQQHVYYADQIPDSVLFDKRR